MSTPTIRNCRQCFYLKRAPDLGDGSTYGRCAVEPPPMTIQTNIDVADTEDRRYTRPIVRLDKPPCRLGVPKP